MRVGLGGAPASIPVQAGPAAWACPLSGRRRGAGLEATALAGVRPRHSRPRYGEGAALRDPPESGPRRLQSWGAAGWGRALAPGSATALPRWARGPLREVGRSVLTCGGAGLSETVWSVGYATRFLVFRKPRVTTEPWAPGTGSSGRPTEGGAGRAARWPSSSASVPSCALRLRGQSLCKVLSVCSLCPGNPGSRSTRAFSLPLLSCPRSAALCTCWASTWNLMCSRSSHFLVSRLLCRTFFKDSSGPSVQVPTRIHRVPSCFQLKDCNCWQGALFHRGQSFPKALWELS